MKEFASRCVCVQVYDGSSDSAPQLGQLCGSQQPSTINSTGNQLYVKLRTDSSVAAGGFLASYSTSNTPIPECVLCDNVLNVTNPCSFQPLSVNSEGF